ncbi:hypothetical protein FQN54_005132 [Arachnomyces sp. PD_36]|nr:hypothetical protein FQN54_005132 [Arachnomyces sp. PD_36]
MRELTGRPNISLPLQSHLDITEEPRGRSAPRPSIPPTKANSKRQALQTGHYYEHERDHEHIEKLDAGVKPTLLEVRRSSFESSATADTVDFVRRIAAGDRKLPITTTTATTEKPKPTRPKRCCGKVGIFCSIFALIALVVIPVICVCILTGVFVPDESRTHHGKKDKEPTTTQHAEGMSTTVHVETTIATSQPTIESTIDPPDVTWLSTATGAGAEVPTTMETRRAEPSSS